VHSDSLSFGDSPVPPNSDGGEPQRLGDFRIVRELGRGAMGVVYLAEQVSLRRVVALKVLPAHLTLRLEAVERFRREASTAARLHHPGIVPIHAIGEEKGTHFFAMEFIQGAPLDQVVRTLREESLESLDGARFREVVTSHGSKPSAAREAHTMNATTEAREGSAAWSRTYVETVCRLVAQVAQALDHAHKVGVIHRDVKPSNILVRPDGTAVLTDFGLAREEGLPALTVTGEFAGTPYYVSPEQAMARRVKVDRRTDVYSLGVTLYELLTLHRPFEGDTVHEVLGKIIAKEPPHPRRWNPLLPRDLVTIVLTAIEKDPDRRYSTASALAHDLTSFLEFRPVTARPLGPFSRTLRVLRRRPSHTVAGALLFLSAVAIVGGAYLLQASRKERRAIEAQLRAAWAAAPAHAAFDDLYPESAGDFAPLSADRTENHPGADERIRRATELFAIAQRSEEDKELDACQATVREAVALFAQETNSPDPAATADLCWKLGFTAHRIGDFNDAREAWRHVLGIQERVLSQDHPSLEPVRANVAFASLTLGDLTTARSLHEKRIAAESSSSHSGPMLGSRARLGLASVARAQGELSLALELQENVARHLQQGPTRESVELLRAQIELATTLGELGRRQEAEILYKQTIDALGRRVADDHPDIQRARLGLATTVFSLGDLVGARALLEKTVAVYVMSCPNEHPALQRARLALARTLTGQGDIAGAQLLREETLRILKKRLPHNHLDVQEARLGLAETYQQLGRLEDAARLQQEALDVYGRILRNDAPAFRAARLGFATTCRLRGELARAREILNDVISGSTEHLPTDHPDLQSARQELAVTLADDGAFQQARALQEMVVSQCERSLPANHPRLADAHRHLAGLYARIGSNDRIGPELDAILQVDLKRVTMASALSTREARQAVRAMDEDIDCLHSLSQWLKRTPPHHEWLFELVETCRSIATLGRLAIVGEDDDPRLASFRQAVSATRQRLSDQIRIADADSKSEPLDVVGAAFRERDAAERALGEELARRGARPIALTARELGARLQPQEAIVTYRRYRRSSPEGGRQWTLTPSLVANIVQPGGILTTIELGPVKSIEAVVEKWLRAMGANVGTRSQRLSDLIPSADRKVEVRGIAGVSEVPKSAGEQREAGNSIRALVLDPVLAALPSTTSLFVCLDVPLHLIAFDALPLGDGFVGDRIRIRNEISLTRLLEPNTRQDGVPSLLAVGGINYDSPASSSPPDLVGSIRSPGAGGTGGMANFAPLPGALAEVRAISEMFKTTFTTEAVVLTGSVATKGAFVHIVPSCRNIHLSTHGFFVTRPRSSDSGRPSLSETLESFAPGALCGVAFAGANARLDTLGKTAGILTADEVAGLDLQNCDLAVLAGCETAVGIRVAGQGVFSLAAALHTANARSALTSRWKVSDEETRDFMVDFYRRLWVQRKPKDEALWEAKRAIRAKGAPLRDWAPWMLTGSPN
jgi:eukaryotic-like serine/threonine-protein kinase